MNRLINKYNKERDEAVASMDVAKFRKFYNKWYDAGFYDYPLPINDRVIEITMRKMAVNITTIPDSVRDEAKAWLLSRGMGVELE